MEKNNQLATTDKVQLTAAMIQSAPSLKGLLEIESVANNWVQTYEKVSGRNDGLMKFEGEKIMFLQQVTSSAGLEKCDKFSVYASFIELAVSGLSLRDGISYIIPYKNKAQFQVGWKGRLEQMSQMPQVVHVSEPICIYEGEEYHIEAGAKLTIRHSPLLGQPEGRKILAVYMTIQMQHGVEFYMMTAEEVLSIRDHYSESYKSYIAALAKPENKGKQPGDKLTISYKDKGTGEWKSFESDETPMWISSEASSFKKTLVKRVYNQLPKLPFQKYLDEKITERLRATAAPEVDEMAQPLHPEEPLDVEAVIEDVMPAEFAGAQPEEVAEAQVVKEEQPKPGTIAPNTEFSDKLPAGTAVTSGGAGQTTKTTVGTGKKETKSPPPTPAPVKQETAPPAPGEEPDLLAGL